MIESVVDAGRDRLRRHADLRTHEGTRERRSRAGPRQRCDALAGAPRSHHAFGAAAAVLIQGIPRYGWWNVASYMARRASRRRLLAVSFGAYAVSLFFGDNPWSGWDNVFASLVVVVMTLINMVGATFVSRVASVMVVVLLGVFAVFVWVTITDVNWHLLAFSGYPLGLEDHLEHRADLLRLPRFRRDDLHGREPPRSEECVVGDGARARADDGHVRVDLDRRVRDLDLRSGDRLRRDCDRRGCAAVARRRRLHADGSGRAHRDRRSDQSDALRLGGANRLAGGDRAVPPVLGHNSRLGKHGGLIVTGILVLLLANFVDLSAIASVA